MSGRPSSISGWIGTRSSSAWESAANRRCVNVVGQADPRRLPHCTMG
jgi:hypothetical protein